MVLNLSSSQRIGLTFLLKWYLEIFKVKLRSSCHPHIELCALLQTLLFHVLLLKSVAFQSFTPVKQSALSSVIYATITGGEV